MALGINGYNDVFRNFAEFAQKSLEAGDEKAIAAVDEQHSLDGRKILTVSDSFSDYLKNWSTWTRRGDAKSANDFARLAAKYVDDAAKAMGAELSRPQKKLAESLVVKYGTDMSEMNAQMFAKFVVRLPLTDDSADLAAPQSRQNDPVLFGSASFTQRLVIDLTQDIPTVVDYKLSQTIA